jgi:hypothetical protein
MESGPEVTDFLAELRSLGEQPPPFPSSELAALLVGGIPISSAPSRRRPDVARRFAAALVAAAVALVVALAAENETLSTEVDRFVSNVTHNPAHPPRQAPHEAPKPALTPSK